MEREPRSVPAASFAGLPIELLPTTLWYMTVDDTIRLRDAVCGDQRLQKMKKECDRRLSARTYLKNNFGYGQELLEAMSHHHVYLSGSRSLEFFIPGSADMHSDWDFYAPTNPSHFVSFMVKMEKLGVRWYEPGDRIYKCAKAGSGQVLLTWDQYTDLERQDCISKVARLFNRNVIKEFETRSRDLVTVNFNDRDEIIINGAVSSYGVRGDLGIIYGEVTRLNHTTEVQLISERRPTIMEVCSPFHFHSSCVQSFIGPHTACHLYGELAAKGESYAWRHDEPGDALTPPNHIAESRLRLAREKYRYRGFSYVDSPLRGLQHLVRESTDGYSTLLIYGDEVDAPQLVRDAYECITKGLTWYELSDTTKLLRSPFSHVDDWYREWFVVDRDEHREYKLKYLGLGRV